MNEKLSTINEIKDYLYSKRKSIFPFELLNKIAWKVSNTCPTMSGEGIHPWIFDAASIFWRRPFYLDEGKIIQLLERATDKCDRKFEPHEIPDAVANSCPFN